MKIFERALITSRLMAMVLIAAAPQMALAEYLYVDVYDDSSCHYMSAGGASVCESTYNQGWFRYEGLTLQECLKRCDIAEPAIL